LRSSCKLCVLCANESVARRLEAVLSADNANVPKDQSFTMRRKSRTLYFDVTSQRLRSPLTTLNSVVTDIALFREIWLISRVSGTRGRRGTRC